MKNPAPVSGVLSVIFLLLTCSAATCPPLSVDISPCSCYSQILGISTAVVCRIEDAVSTTPQRIRDILSSAFDGIPISALSVQGIPGPFELPDNFLTGQSIEFVYFGCDHNNSAANGPLAVGSDTFVDATSGRCTLGASLAFQGCNMGPFNAQSLDKCGQQLVSLDFSNSNVESIVNLPRMDRLQSLNVNGWQFKDLGLTEFKVDSERLPKLTALELNYNRLTDDDIKFIADLPDVENITMRGNHFSGVPDFSSLRRLTRVDMYVEFSETNDFSFSLRLPTNRTTIERLVFYLWDAKSYQRHSVQLTSIKGDISNAIIILYVNMTGVLDESVYYEPLKTGGDKFTIVMDPGSRFDCINCGMAWLFRDNPDLLQRLDNGFGVCQDGRYFEDIKPQEFANCTALKMNKLKV